MKKKILKAAFLLMIAACAACAFPMAVSASSADNANPEAERASLRYSYENIPNEETGRLKFITDGDKETFYKAARDIHLKFTASVPVKSLYFMFEKPCKWKLTLPDGTVKQGGENEFMHEYFSLESEVTEFEIDIPQDSWLTDVFAFSDGALPDWVQIWQPPCERADLLVLPTHADDEYAWFGGALPYYAGELGYNVQVVYLTNHFNNTIRNHELLNALWYVGVRNYPLITDRFLDTMDTREDAESVFGRENVLEFQVEILRRFAPRVILAHDINGEYGHAAHILNASTLLDALEIYENPEIYPESAKKYGIYKIQKCYLHLWPKNTIVVPWGAMFLSKFGGKSSLKVAIKGLAFHKSQEQYGIVARDWGKKDCRKFGLAYTTVGPDTNGLNDLFEHVDFNDSIEIPPEPSEPVSVVSQTDVSSQSITPENVKKQPRIPVWVIILAVILVLVNATALIFAGSLKKQDVKQGKEK